MLLEYFIWGRNTIQKIILKEEVTHYGEKKVILKKQKTGKISERFYHDV